MDTPNIDRIAADRVRYTQWHTTALCSPARSCLLTGRNPTRSSVACITEAALGFEILGERGWNTYVVGKWHLCPTLTTGTRRSARAGSRPSRECSRWPVRGSHQHEFTGGTIKRVAVDLSGDPYVDLEREARAVLARE